MKKWIELPHCCRDEVLKFAGAKTSKFFSVGVFMFALAMNITASLGDPFNMNIAHAVLTYTNGNTLPGE